MTLNEILKYFQNPVPAGNGYNVHCPAHSDNKASLSVTSGKKGVLFKCQAGCLTPDIVQAVGLTMADLFFQPVSQNGHHQNGTVTNNGSKKWQLIETYDYFKPDGSPAFQVQRMLSAKGKEFPIRWKNDSGEWVNGTSAGEYFLAYGEWWRVKPTTNKNLPRRQYPALQMYLYKLPELLASDYDDYVFIVEGEKDVDRCRSLGLIATCNPQGAGKWQLEYNQYFENRIVVIIPDNDPPPSVDPITGKPIKGFQGQSHAKEIFDSLAFTDATALVLDLPGLPIKGDISDWFDAGNTADQLRALVDKALSSPPQSSQSPPPPPNPPGQQSSQQQSIPKQYNTTDMGNAERFTDKFGDVVRYCSKLGKDGIWLIWDGKRWQMDERLKIHGMAKEIVPDIYTDAQNATYKADKERIFRWAVQTEGLATRNNMVKDARPSLAISADDLDKHIWLLNCLNGTVDLRTGKLLPHSQNDYLTKLVPVEYDEQAECPEWEKFLKSSQQDNQDVIDYIQKAVGYSLTGDVSEKCIFVLHGPPHTGKSTFIEAIQYLLEEYAVKIQTQTIMYQRERGIPNDIAKLKGARFVHASEAEENERFAESRLKEMTGGDTLCGCFKYGEEFQFTPTHKLWLSTNHKPRVSGDKAIWERIKLIPFVHEIPKEKWDRSLRDKIRTEAPGILRWAVEGCLKWRTDGLVDPQTVIGATGKYHDEQDIIGHFIDEYCELDPAYTEMAGNLYSAYKQWCTDNGERIESQRAFGFKLNDRNLYSKKGTSGNEKGKVKWYGIRLISSQQAVGF